jgi:hypothetical protein
MDVTILCENGDYEHGVSAHIVESALAWLKTGDHVHFQVAENGTTWLRHDGHGYQFALHGLSEVVEDQQVFLLRIVN